MPWCCQKIPKPVSAACRQRLCCNKIPLSAAASAQTLSSCPTGELVEIARLRNRRCYCCTTWHVIQNSGRKAENAHNGKSVDTIITSVDAGDEDDVYQKSNESHIGQKYAHCGLTVHLACTSFTELDERSTAVDNCTRQSALEIPTGSFCWCVHSAPGAKPLQAMRRVASLLPQSYRTHSERGSPGYVTQRFEGCN